MVIGLTGGIGSGKSAVLDILEKDHGASVIVADDVARMLEMPGGRCYEGIVDEFGTEILEGGKQGNPIDRAALAKIVFSDNDKLETLNYIVHPMVRIEIMLMIAGNYNRNPDALIVVEAALMMEGNLQDLLDELWLVRADRDIRIDRLKGRGVDPDRAADIMETQMSDEEYMQWADRVIDNSGTMDELRIQIDDILKEVL